MLKFCKGQELNRLKRDGENGELVQGIVKSPDALQKHVMSVPRSVNLQAKPDVT
jgi:hypothetical protein